MSREGFLFFSLHRLPFSLFRSSSFQALIEEENKKKEEEPQEQEEAPALKKEKKPNDKAPILTRLSGKIQTTSHTKSADSFLS